MNARASEIIGEKILRTEISHAEIVHYQQVGRLERSKVFHQLLQQISTSVKSYLVRMKLC